MDRSSAQKSTRKQCLEWYIRTEIFIDLYRTFHPNAAEYTFFSRAHGTFSSIDHVLVNKTSLDKFLKTIIILGIFSNHNGLELEINYKKKNWKKLRNMWRLNNMLLNMLLCQWRNQRWMPEDKWKLKYNTPKPMRYRNIFPFTCIFFNFFHQCFTVCSVQVFQFLG